jgi:hypothetical protein
MKDAFDREIRVDDTIIYSSPTINCCCFEVGRVLVSGKDHIEIILIVNSASNKLPVAKKISLYLPESIMIVTGIDVAPLIAARLHKD